MTVDDELILGLEKLAKLKLTAEERAELKSDLSQMLAMVDKLKELKTESVEPLIFLNEENKPWREDKIQKELGQTEALKNARHVQDGFFKVPKVLKNKSKKKK